MLKKNRSYYAFFLIIAPLTQISTSMFGVILSVSVDQKNDKVVCRIGEVHRAVYEPNAPWAAYEERDKNNMLKLIEQCSKSHDPIAIILETSDYANESCKNTIARLDPTGNCLKIGTAVALPFFAQQHNRNFGNAQFMFADIRGPAIGDVSELFNIFYGPDFAALCVLPLFENDSENSNPDLRAVIAKLIAKPDAESLDKVLSLSQKFHDYYYSGHGPFIYLKKLVSPSFHGSSVSDLNEEIDVAKQRITAIMKAEDPSSALYAFLQRQLQNISAAMAQACNFFGSNKSSQARCIDLMFDSIQKVSFSFLYDQWKKWGMQLTDSLADAGFAIELHEVLKHYNKVIFFGGNNHATALGELVSQLEFVPTVSSEGLLKTSYNPTCSSSISQFSDQQMHEIFASIERALKLPKECALCLMSKADLLRCSACKKIYYCSAECQRKDWALHKKGCKKI